MRDTIETSASQNDDFGGDHAAALIDGDHKHDVAVQHRERLVLVYGPRLLRECLRRSLKSTTTYEIADFASLEEWSARDAGRMHASLVLLGLGSMPDDEVGAVLTLALERANKTPVVVTCEREDPAFIYQVLAKGVRGYIPTSLPLEVSVGALQVVRAGGVFAPAGSFLVAPTKIVAEVPASTPTPASVFTAKQLAVIGAIRKGKANKTIAYELNMCESTVKVHVRNIMKKMHARNRTEVAFIASNTLGDKVP